MYKIGLISDRDTALPFKALGINTYQLDSSINNLEDLIKRLTNENYAVIFITEELAKNDTNLIEKYNEKLIPSIVLIPGINGTSGIAMDNLKKSVEKAIGINILKGREEDNIERG